MSIKISEKSYSPNTSRYAEFEWESIAVVAVHVYSPSFVNCAATTYKEPFMLPSPWENKNAWVQVIEYAQS